MKRLTIEIDDELKRQAKARASIKGYSLKEWIVRLIQKALQNNNHQ